jgi:tRNA (guanine37-N1)-methyltransferase
MRFDVITLFPDLFAPHLEQGVTRRAFEGGQVNVKLWPLRDFAENNYRRVDDRPYGAGPGMLLLSEPLECAMQAVLQARADSGAPVVHFTPTGQRLDQTLVQTFCAGTGAVLICGRYEGIDQRFLDRHVSIEVSLGDFVLSGGELPALALLDAVARLQPGVLGDAQSHEQDSFSAGLLDCPHYTRPAAWHTAEGAVLNVPDVLLSGNHAQISRWRRQRALEITLRRRPDLLAQARLAKRLTPEDEIFLNQL